MNEYEFVDSPIDKGNINWNILYKNEPYIGWQSNISPDIEVIDFINYYNLIDFKYF